MGGLTNLVSLSLDRSQVSDLTPLAGLTRRSEVLTLLGGEELDGG